MTGELPSLAAAAASPCFLSSSPFVIAFSARSLTSCFISGEREDCFRKLIICSATARASSLVRALEIRTRPSSTACCARLASIASHQGGCRRRQRPPSTCAATQAPPRPSRRSPVGRIEDK